MFFWREDDAITATLWTMMTWFADNLNTAPYLGIRSPERECGKTTLLTVIRYLAYHSMPSSNLTSAAAFRLLDMHTLTLLVDELDTFLRIDPAFLNIMYAGHSREMGRVARCVGDEQEVRDFNAFGPKAYGMIGGATDTLESRSLPIILYRAMAEDNLEPLNFEDFPEQKIQLQTLARKIARWAKDNRAPILAIKPSMAGVTNRFRDNWRPLFRIAEFAGGEWLEKAYRAAGLKDPTESKSVNRIFIEDVRNIFYTRNAPFIPSNVLLADLHAQQESGWLHYGKTKDGMNQMDLAAIMKAYGIKAERERLDGARCRGYNREQFLTAFQRFLSKVEPEEVELSNKSTPELETYRQAKLGTGQGSASSLQRAQSASNNVSLASPPGVEETAPPSF
jgi:hypothetical protein